MADSFINIDNVEIQSILPHRFSSCHDLVMSRFCATDFKPYKVTGVKIHRIIRIHNRILRAQFDKKLIRVTEGPPGEYYPGTK